MRAEWFEFHLTRELMPRWLEAAVTPNGLFYPHLDRQWQRRAPAPVTLVSQSRLIHNFARTYRLTLKPDYRHACRAGADALLRDFRTDRRGAWRWSVTLDGEPADNSLSLYGLAFVVFGLSHADRALADWRYLEAADETVRFIFDHFRDAHGGFMPALDADGRDTGATRSQNPIMHLFEALMALAEAAGDRQYARLAAEVCGWVLERLLEPHELLFELYTPTWEPLPAEDGGYVDIGHQFEWAFLLSHAAELGILRGPDAERALEAGERMLSFALAAGYDEEEGGVWSPVVPGRGPLTRSKGWWEQCEAARALFHYARVRGHEDLLARYQQTVAFWWEHLMDHEHMGWFMRVEPDGTVRNTDKGNVWKVDYHVVGLAWEVLRHARDLEGDRPCWRE